MKKTKSSVTTNDTETPLYDQMVAAICGLNDWYIPMCQVATSVSERPNTDVYDVVVYCTNDPSIKYTKPITTIEEFNAVVNAGLAYCLGVDEEDF